MSDPVPSDPAMDADRIPINVITGFLGSGKTTLLKQLLASPELGDTAVLINEFGEIGLDHYLLEKVDERTVVLDSGCICCTVREDLGTAARELYQRRERREIPAFRRLVIETTGLADPVPILHTLRTEPVVRERFRLGNVVTTVDAVNADRHLSRHGEAAKQAAVADRIVVTKTDLVSKPAVEALTARLRRLNPGAQLLYAPARALDPGALLDGAAYDPATKPAAVRAWLNEEAYRAAPSPSDHGHEPYDEHRHDAHIAAFCLTFDEPLDWEAFAIWLTMLLHKRGADVLRVKGLINVAESEGPVVVHGAQHLIHPPEHLARWPDEDRRTRLVFICRDIPRESIERSLRTFLRLPRLAAERAPDAALMVRASGGTTIGGRPVRRPSAPAWMK
ncbi:MAG TPA: GTP-binding protein [Alphaproteobacteria bacterium]|nr:GTP-binding protein [Alphaproteobacteria bacterium]